MCFSATASFTASAVLSVVGVSAIKKANNPNQTLFASIPFIFAVQQFSEGFVWLALSNPAFAPVEKVFTYTFLFFAQMVWPLCVPLAIALMEKDSKRKKLLYLFVGVGVVVTAYFAHRLLMYGAKANIGGHHVAYRQIYPDSLGHIADLCYGIATMVPTFLSKTKKVWLFGLVVGISYIITYVCFEHYILSVWCFFSALISVIIYSIIKGIESPSRV